MAFKSLRYLVVLAAILALATAISVETITSCVPPGASLKWIKTVQCPCFLSFGIRTQGSLNVSVDFLVVDGSFGDTHKSASVAIVGPKSIPQWSIWNATAKLKWLGEVDYIFESGRREVNKAVALSLFIQTRSQHSIAQCNFKTAHVFTAQPTPCSKAAEAGRKYIHVPDNHVVAGNTSSFEMRRVMAWITSWNGSCSGSVITADTILTAAHCESHTGSKIWIGGRTTTDGSVHIAKEVSVHPGYKRGVDGLLGANDIAIVRFSPALSQHSSGWMRLNTKTNASDARGGAVAVASGYGLYAENWISGESRELRSVNVPIVGLEQCRRGFDTANYTDIPIGMGDSVTEQHICAGGQCGDTCQGDSGGPLTIALGNADMVQIGVTTGGVGCGRSGLAGVYTDVARYWGWIRGVVGGDVVGMDGAKNGVGNVEKGEKDEKLDMDVSGVRDDRMSVWTGVVASIVAVGVVMVVVCVIRCCGWGERTKKGNVGAEIGVFVKGADVKRMNTKMNRDDEEMKR